MASPNNLGGGKRNELVQYSDCLLRSHFGYARVCGQRYSSTLATILHAHGLLRRALVAVPSVIVFGCTRVLQA